MRRNLILALGLALVCACAADRHRPGDRQRDRLPLAAEVEAFVRQHWQGYAARFAWFLSRRDEAAALVSVDAVSCRYDFDTPLCRFRIGGRFAAGDLHFTMMSDHFRWNAQGQLELTIMLHHER